MDIITCPACQGKGKTPSYRDSKLLQKCGRCRGKGVIAEPTLAAASLRRWIKIGHALAAQPRLTAADVDHELGNVYGRAAIAGILGAMNSDGLLFKSPDSPAQWSLNESGFKWQALFCRDCLRRLPEHKTKGCSAPLPINEPGVVPGALSEEPSALASLLGTSIGGRLEIAVPLGREEEAMVAADTDGERVVEVAGLEGSLSPEAAVALGEALVRAGRHLGA
jgi:hypothetical protein